MSLRPRISPRLGKVLNFAVIAAVCVIWRPTERSKLLSTHQQLATGELDDDDDDDAGGDDDDLEKFGRGDGDELDDLDLDDDLGGAPPPKQGGYGQIGGDDDGIEMR